ncbi:MAG: stage II sporulation protein M [Thermoproteota archaeon]|nr:stage II sporulation protein M [Candidatus Brockarchaeota archaeon]MBO3801270.1 stage II sporulation protein M [Candidatus Brockarchaeota archaeon]
MEQKYFIFKFKKKNLYKEILSKKEQMISVANPLLKMFNGNRGTIFLIVFVILVTTTFFGTFYPPDRKLENELRQMVDEFKGSNVYSVALKIFSNNALIASGMIIPLFGIGLSIYSTFSTGVAISSISSISNNLVNPQVAFFGVLIMPHGLLEYISYSLIVTENVILTYKIIGRQKDLKNELGVALIAMLLSYILLLFAGLIEAFFISPELT